MIVCAVLLAAGGALVWLVHSEMRQEALAEAESKARILLDRNLATHTYFSHQLKPKVFELLKRINAPDYFEPAWMSSTYAVRGIDNYFKDISPGDFYYKECAINARTPANEADPYEGEFIKRLNSDPGLEMQSGIREINGRRFYVVLRRGEVMEKTCLRCHSTAKLAPAGLVARYGGVHSFGRSEGEVVSAVSIRIPLEEALARAETFTRRLALYIAALLLAVGLVLGLLSRRLFTLPLRRMRARTAAIAKGGEHLGEQLELDLPGEWNLLAGDFNAMSTQLRSIYDGLEDKVAQRTAEMQRAQDEAKTLGGLLPICANCKKIRDDKGYWHQVEAYLAEHSDARFSHGICPECKKKLYPEI